MNTRLLLTTLFLFFLFQSAKAQDTAKSAKKSHHTIKHTSQTTHPKNQVHAKDSAKIRAVHPIKIPKYKRDGYVTIMGGYGIPTGAYASSAFASTGSVFSVCAGFPGIISHLGIAFKFDYGANSLNQAQYITNMNNVIMIPNINYSFTGTQEPFSYETILTGIYLTYPAKKISVDGRILGGAMLATYPAFKVNIADAASGTNGTFIQSEMKGNAFAIDFGIDVRYRVIPKLSVMLSVDYLHADPSFTNISTDINQTAGAASLQGYEEGSPSQAFDLFNFSLGIGYTISAQKPTTPKTN